MDAAATTSPSSPFPPSPTFPFRRGSSERDMESDVGDRSDHLALTCDVEQRGAIDPKLNGIHKKLQEYEASDAYEAGERKGLRNALRKFYAVQRARVESYAAMRRLELQESAEEREAKSAAADKLDSSVRWAMNGSLALTFVFILLKVFIAVWSGSIAVVASAVDSVFDVLSQGSMALSDSFMRKRDPHSYPIGKSRMESLSVLIFAVMMGLAGLFLAYESVDRLLSGLETTPELRIDAVTLAVLGFVVAVQTFMHFWCKSIVDRGNASADGRARNLTAVDALAQDHWNDVMVNVIGGIPAIVAGYEPNVWYLDAIGGIGISLYIFARWAITTYEHFMSLMGQAADSTFLSQLTYLAMLDPRVLKVDTVLAYQLGTKMHCEVHIVLPDDMPLRIAHDIGESLEQSIEKIDGVELAWVHLDFEYSHSAEHNRWNL